MTLSRKVKVYTLRTIAILAAVFILLYLGLFLYVKSNKVSLIRKAEAALGNSIGGKISIRDLSVSPFNNFPYISLNLKNIEIRDSMFSKHGHSFFRAENLFLRLNPLRLMIADISINKMELDSGSIYLFTDTSGYSNAYLLKGKDSTAKTSEKSDQKNPFHKVRINRTSITIDDRSNNKLFDFFVSRMDLNIIHGLSEQTIEVEEAIKVRKLAFNRDAGSYFSNHSLTGKFEMHFSPKKQELRFDSIPMDISDQRFYLTGLFQLGKVQQFNLRGTTKKVTVDFAKSLLLPKTAQGIGLVTVKYPVDAAATLTGSLSGGDPLIVARWSTEKNAITSPLLDFENCSLSGLYTNEVVKGLPRNDPNSKIEIYGFKGDWHGITMSSDKMLINNLTIPVMTADLRSTFELAHFNSIIQSDALALTTGTGSLDLLYNGPFDHITSQNTTLTGVLGIKNGNMLFGASKSALSNVNASIRFANSDLIIDRLDCNIQRDPLHISGVAKNALLLLGDAPGKMGLTLNITAPVINVDHITHLLYRKLPPRKTTVDKNAGSLVRTTQQVDALLSSGHVSIALNADKLRFHKFEAQRAVAEIEVDENSWRLKKAALQHGAGSMLVTGLVSEQANSRFRLDANLQMNNLDARKIWYEFENFGIPDLSYQNLRGSLTTSANVSLLLDKAGEFDMNTMTGSANFSLKNGALINYKPLQAVQTFVLKNRDFSDINFAEIKDHVTFSKGVVNIDRMEINSSVLSLFVEGIYGIKGNTDISIQVPLSNLKKRDKDYKPENLGADRGGGMSVFLRARNGADGVIAIKYDPFKRFRKSPTATPKAN